MRPPPTIPSGPTATDNTCGSPSDDDNDVQYPNVSTFLTELTKTEGNFHYFENFTDAFHESGFYRIDQLADESFTVNDMLKSIAHLKEGTARVIKKRAVEKVRRIRKGKGRN